MNINFRGVAENVRISLLPPEQWSKVRSQYILEKLDKELATEVLLKVKKIFDAVECPFFLSNGTALGFYRDGDFIPWDDEIDIDVKTEDFLPVYLTLAERFLREGFIVRTTPRGESSKMSLFYKGIKVAIGGVYEDMDKPGYRQAMVYQWLSSFYENPTSFQFAGETFLLLGPKEEYLTFCYGKDWRTPIVSTEPMEYMNRESGQFKEFPKGSKWENRILNKVVSKFYFLRKRLQQRFQ